MQKALFQGSELFTVDGLGDHGLLYSKEKKKNLKKGMLLVPLVKLVKLTQKTSVGLAINGLGVSQRGL